MKTIRIGETEFPVKDYYCAADLPPGYWDDEDDSAAEGYAPKPDGKLWLYVHLTDVCNGACPFCINPGRPAGDSPFDPKRFKEVLRTVREHVAGVSLTGGEPMLQPELVDEAVDAVNETFGPGRIAIDLVTNGTGFRELAALRNLRFLDSVHLSRHALSDDENDRLLGFESVKAEAAAIIIDSLSDPGKIVLNCVLMKGGIDSAEKAAEYMELAASMGVRNVSFIGMSRCNPFCEKHYVDPAKLGLADKWRFHFQNSQWDHEYCSCASGYYEGRAGSPRFYYRSMGSGTAPYVRQLVYTADNRLLAGFGGPEIPVGEAPKRYKIGMYGGKFLPFHKGHRYCVEVAARECETVYVILFHSGADEERILKEQPELWLSVEERTAQLERICEACGSMAKVIPALIDTSGLRLPDGSEDWDAETPLVRALVGDRLDAVYSSEESYGAYFSRAYPEAVHWLVDVKRILYPISGTEIRQMEDEEARRQWMI